MCVTVPAHGPGVSVGHVCFLEASWIPRLEQPKPYSLAALQMRSGQYHVGLLSSTYTKISAAR